MSAADSTSGSATDWSSTQADIGRLNKKIEDLDTERVKLKGEFDSVKIQIERCEGIYEGLTRKEMREEINKKEEAFNKKEEAIYAAIHDLRQEKAQLRGVKTVRIPRVVRIGNSLLSSFANLSSCISSFSWQDTSPKKSQ